MLPGWTRGDRGRRAVMVRGAVVDSQVFKYAQSINQVPVSVCGDVAWKSELLCRHGCELMLPS